MEYVLYPLVHAETVSFFDKPVYRYFLQCEGQSVSAEGIRKHYPDAERMMWDLMEVYEEHFSLSKIGKAEGEAFDHGKGAVARYLVQHAAAFVYTAYIIAGKEHLPELREIDGKMKQKSAEVYRLTSGVKRIGMMRKTGLRLFGLYEKMFGGEVS
jgi:hypothetical protein